MPADRFISYAQNLEDVMLWRALHQAVPDTGRYIDIGASDPTALSVTRAFYDRGWRGLNVEPLPEVAEQLRLARPGDMVVQAAVAETAGTRRFHRVVAAGQTGLSTLDAAEAARHAGQGAAVEALDVPVTTLAELCRTFGDGPVHFLKIDVEGGEAAVLAGADFTLTRPWIVLLEATRPNSETASDHAWEPALLAAGYRFVWFDGLNRFYLAEEHAALARHFQVPPNVFDHYTQWNSALHATLAATEALAAARLALIQTLESEVEALTEKQATPPPAAEPEPEPAIILPAPAAPGLAAIRLPRVARRVLGLGWRGVRPLVRPLAWRARQFLIGPVLTEAAGLRAQQAHLQHRFDQGVGTAATADDGGLARAMERALLTLALQDGRDPAPPGLAPDPGLSNPEPPR